MASREQAWSQQQLQAPHEVADKAGRVRCMFNAIAPRYELVNTVFSFGCDKMWRRRAVRMAEIRSDDDVLDIACGTGDFARAFAAANPASVVGCDFATEMLALASKRPPPSITWCDADALCLPFADQAFSITSCAFGVRNFQDLQKGLGEMYRVLRPGGRAVILEFTRPRRRLFRAMYELYANRVMPVAASIISRDRSGAYRYLPRSVVSFPDSQKVSDILKEVGFARVEATPLTMGIVAVYIARRD